MALRIDQLQAGLPGDIEAVEAAMKVAVREALLRHKQAGNSIAAWENGKVQWITADKIDLTQFDVDAANAAAQSKPNS